MPITVKFPDGEREVPSVTREIKSKQVGGGPSVFDEEPAYDPDWRFVGALGNVWHAIKRNP